VQALQERRGTACHRAAASAAPITAPHATRAGADISPTASTRQLGNPGVFPTSPTVAPTLSPCSPDPTHGGPAGAPCCSHKLLCTGSGSAARGEPATGLEHAAQAWCRSGLHPLRTLCVGAVLPQCQAVATRHPSPSGNEPHPSGRSGTPSVSLQSPGPDGPTAAQTPAFPPTRLPRSCVPLPQPQLALLHLRLASCLAQPDNAPCGLWQSALTGCV
jgi:hypothetical protein